MTCSPPNLIIQKTILSVVVVSLTVITAWICFFIFFRLILPVGGTREAARAPLCRSNLRIISMALANYHEVWGTFPPAHFADKNGRPIHSWRVILLPFIDRNDLYRRYRFDEPWDGPHNSQLHSEFVQLYSCPSDPQYSNNPTSSYFAVVGPETLWSPDVATQQSDVTDPHTTTITVVEVANSGIHWMQPVDIEYSQLATSPWPPIGERASHIDEMYFVNSDPYEHAGTVGFADMRIRRSATGSDLQPLFTISGSEDVSGFFDAHAELDVRAVPHVGVVAEIFFLLACPLIVGGPLILYLLAPAWQRTSLKKRLVTSITVAAMAAMSYKVLLSGSEFWIIKLYVVAVFWLVNIPVIALIVFIRRMDRWAKALARTQTINKTGES